MAEIVNSVKSWFSLLPAFTISNLLEVLIIAFIIYEILLLIKNSHAFTLLKGIIVIFIFTLLASLLRLDNILYILQRISTVAVIAVVVIFQPELRKGLETLGKQAVVSKFVPLDSGDTAGMTEKTIKEISRAVFEMAKVKTGALIVIEHSEELSDYVNTGIRIDGIVTSALLINIFEKNTPLHDGAVIIKGNTIIAATCYLPLSDSESISKDLGTRHRAAIGMSEATDAAILVVSEETGHISLAKDGELSRVMSYENLTASLKEISDQEKKKSSTKVSGIVKKDFRKKTEKKTVKTDDGKGEEE